MQTRNGIELDITKSNYRYDYNGLEFYFSSEFYLRKFRENLHYYLFTENTKITGRYQVKANLTLFLAIALYKKIEKRGFYIIYRGENLTNCKIDISIY